MVDSHIPFEPYWRPGAVAPPGRSTPFDRLVTALLCLLVAACPVVVTVMIVKQDHIDRATHFTRADGTIHHASWLPQWAVYGLFAAIAALLLTWLTFWWVTRIRPID